MPLNETRVVPVEEAQGETLVAETRGYCPLESFAAALLISWRVL
jgi:hypothetical protein